jgi:hypothetical protein
VTPAGTETGTETPASNNGNTLSESDQTTSTGDGTSIDNGIGNQINSPINEVAGSTTFAPTAPIIIELTTAQPLVLKLLTWKVERNKLIWIYRKKGKPIVNVWADNKKLHCKVQKVGKSQWRGICILKRTTVRYCIKGPGQKKKCVKVKRGVVYPLLVKNF